MSELQRYCVGFALNPQNTHVLLIKKNRPDWQKGYLNGVGGKVEKGETTHRAMAREFKEETGIDHSTNQWTCYSVIEYPDTGKALFFFMARIELAAMLEATYKPPTDEELHLSEIRTLNLGELKTLPNVVWQVHMAIAMMDDDAPDLFSVKAVRS